MDSEFLKGGAAMERLCSFDQRLGRHAPDARADCPPGTIVDNGEIVSSLLYFPESSQSRGTGADDDNVESFTHEDFLFIRNAGRIFMFSGDEVSLLDLAIELRESFIQDSSLAVS
jgi:hypothetical protein